MSVVIDNGSDGLRRRTVENGTTTDYLLDGPSVVQESIRTVEKDETG